MPNLKCKQTIVNVNLLKFVIPLLLVVFCMAGLAAADPITITTTSLPSGQVNSAYNQTINATGGTLVDSYDYDDWDWWYVCSGYLSELVSGTMPAGMSFVSTNGYDSAWLDQGEGFHSGPYAGLPKLTGTPTQAGNFPFTVKVTDYLGATATMNYVLTVTGSILNITTTSMPDGQVNYPYAKTLTAVNGTAPYTWSVVSSSLPAGLSIISSTGVVTGTPTTGGTTNVTFKVVSSDSQEDTQALSIYIAPALSITTVTVPTATLSAAYNTTINVTGGIQYECWVDDPYEPWYLGSGYRSSIISGSLAAGLSLASTNGGPGNWSSQNNTYYSNELYAGLPKLTGTPTQAGTFPFTLQVEDYFGATTTRDYVLVVQAGTLAITTASLPDGEQDYPYSAAINYTGGLPPYEWSVISNSLPAGLSLGSPLITGTATVTGTYYFTLQVTSSDQQTATKALSIYLAPPLTLLTQSPLPAAIIGQAYNTTLSATGGILVDAYDYDEYDWWYICSGYLVEQISGTNPAGINFVSTNGAHPHWLTQAEEFHNGLYPGLPQYIGTPTVTGVYNAAVRITDFLGAQSTVNYSLTVNYDFNIDTQTIAHPHKDVPFYFALSASGAPGPYTWSVINGSLPAGLTLDSATGVLTGTSTAIEQCYVTFQVAATDPVLNPIAQKQLLIDARDTWDNTTGGDHQGADWTISSNTTIGGEHINVATFTVAAGTTVTFNTGSGKSIFADNMYIDGLVQTEDRADLLFKCKNDFILGPNGCIDLMDMTYGNTYNSVGNGANAGDYLSGGGGASHIGQGGIGGGPNGGLPGQTYGTIYFNELSGGAKGGCVVPPEAEDPYGGMGGLATIIAGNKGVFEGIVAACGHDGQNGVQVDDLYTGGGGGGAGGGIMIHARYVYLASTAILSASGGGGGVPHYPLTTGGGGGGGGGEIKIYGEVCKEEGVQIDVSGGPAGSNDATPGESGCYSENETQSEPKNDATTAGDPIFLNTGEFYHKVTDLNIPGRGFPFQFNREYRALSSYDGPLGYGWELNYNARLEKIDGGIKYHDVTGRSEKYPGSEIGLVSPPGSYTDLIYDNVNDIYTMTMADGEIRTFGVNTVNPNIYNITSITDRNGNQMTFGYGDNLNADGVQNVLLSITDTLGRVIDLTWTADNRIDYFEDWTDRKIDFTYDERGDLVGVTYPATTEYPTGNTATYTYSNGYDYEPWLDHNMLTIKDPKGQTYITNVYDGRDRVIEQTYGYGKFINEYIDATETEPAKVKVTDRENNLIEYWLTPEGNVSKKIEYTRGIRSSDPASFTTDYVHDSSSTERKKTIFPKGNSIEKIYDSDNPITKSRGNVLYVVQKDIYNQALTTTYTYELRFNQIKTVTDSLERTTTLYYDYEEGPDFLNTDLNGDGRTDQANGNLVKITYPSVTVGLSAGQTIEAKFRYNDNGQLVRYVDPEGNIDFYEYYTSGAMQGYLYKITKDEGGEGIVNKYEYDDVGNVTGIYDGKNNKTTFVINQVNQIVETVTRAPFNYKVKMYYDENTKLVKTEIENKDKDGNLDSNMPWITTEYDYNLLDKLTSRTEKVSGSESIVTSYGYDKNGNMDLYTQPLLNKIKRTYDERNLLFETIRGYDTTDWTSTKLFYDLNGNLKRIIDGRGNETEYLIDGFDRYWGYEDAEGNRTEYTLNTVGNVTRIIRKNSLATVLSDTKFFYDELNRRYETREWLNTTSVWVKTQFGFNKNSRITSIIDDSSHETEIFYDGLGRVTKAEDHLGNKVEYDYDANSNIETITESEKTPSDTYLTFITQNQYDNLDRLTESTNPITVTRSYRYDSRGNCTYTIDGEGNTINNFYDGLGRLNKIVRDIREGGKGSGTITDTITTEYKFDKNSRLYNLVDDKGNVTGYLYDELNRRKEESYPDFSRRQFFYDGADNVRQIRDPNGSVIDQTFDDLNRLTRRDITRGAGVLGVTYETFDYDGLSRMISASNNDSSVGMLYDTLSRLAGESQQIGGQSVKYVASEYDNTGNRTQLTYPGGKVVTIVPDNLDRISQIKDNSANIIAQYAYVGPFRIAQRDYLNGTKLNVDYDANRRITGFEHALSGTAFAGFTYAFDKEDNKLFEKRTQDSNNGDAYLYDSIYRVTGVKYGVPNLSPSSSYADYTTYANKEEFTLDGVGNRTQLSTDLLTTDYLVNNLNQYYQINSTPHSYDSNGNLKDDGTYLYYFDYLNRLMEVKRKSDNVSIVTFTYDALGRRIQKVNNLQTTTVNYYYDMGSVIEERDGNDATTATFVFGNEMLQMSVPVSSILHPVSGDFYYHANTQGSIYAVTNSSGNMVEQYKYSVCGEASFFDGSGNPISQSAIGNTRLFAGLERDGEVGNLYKILGKNFSSALNRFIQADIPANDNLFSPYTCANNNSVDVMPMSAGMPGGILPYSKCPPPCGQGSTPPPPPPPPEAVTPPTPPLPPTGAVTPPPPEAVGQPVKVCETQASTESSTSDPATDESGVIDRIATGIVGCIEVSEGAAIVVAGVAIATATGVTVVGIGVGAVVAVVGVTDIAEGAMHFAGAVTNDKKLKDVDLLATAMGPLGEAIGNARQAHDVIDTVKQVKKVAYAIRHPVSTAIKEAAKGIVKAYKWIKGLFG